MKRIVVIIGFVLIILIGILGFNKLFNNNVSDDEKRFVSEYEKINNQKWEIDGYEGRYLELNLPKNNLIKYANNDNIVSLLTSGTQVVYFGNAYCNWCRSAVSVLIDTALEYNLDVIYYYDFFSLRDAYEDGSNQELVLLYEDIINEVGEFIDNTFGENSKVFGKKRLSAPTVVIVSDGEVVDAHYKTVDSHINYNSDLNTKQKDELKNIYLDMFKKLVYACGSNC